MFHRALLLLATIAATACREKPRPLLLPDPPPTAAAPSAIAPGPEASIADAGNADAAAAGAPGGAVAPTAKARSLVVASEVGIREVGFDGRAIRTLTKTPAERPRFLPGEHEVVFYVGDEGGVQGEGEVRRLSLETGAVEKVAVLPESFRTCGKMPDYAQGHVFARDSLRIQDDDDFVLDRSGGAVCMALQDRNTNMMNVRVELRIDVASGAVLHRVEHGGDCAKKPASWTGCHPRRSAAARAAPFSVASLDAGVEVTEEQVSPSGGWSVLSVLGYEGGDYVYRSLYLLDRKARRIFPIVAGPFLPPITPHALAANDPSTFTAVGETPVRWLDGDALVVGTLLVLPGQRAVDVHGDVAQ